mgnify:CR=1 FL=1
MLQPGAQQRRGCLFRVCRRARGRWRRGSREPGHVEHVVHSSPEMVIGEPLMREPPHDLSDPVHRVLGDLSELQPSDGFPAWALLVQPESGGVAEGERLPSGSEVEESRFSLVPRILINRSVLSLSRRRSRVSVCPRGNTGRVAVDNLCAPRPRLETQQRRFPALHDVWWQCVPQPPEQGLGPVLTPLPERGVHGLV